MDDGKLHLFTVNVASQTLRFMIIKKPDGYGTALDACRICGAEGYRQDGQNVVCRHCGSHIDGSDIVMDLPSLGRAAQEVPR